MFLLGEGPLPKPLLPWGSPLPGRQGCGTQETVGTAAPDAPAQRATRSLALRSPGLPSVSETTLVSWALAKGFVHFASLGPAAGAAGRVLWRRAELQNSPPQPARGGPGGTWVLLFPLRAIAAEGRRPPEGTGLTLVPRCLNEEPGPSMVTEG